MKKSNLVIIVILAIFILLLFFPHFKNPVRAIFINRTIPIGRQFSTFGTRIARNFSFIGQISSLKKQNEELSAKITQLEVDKSLIAELQIENKTLERELGFIEDKGVASLIPSKIVMREPSSFLDNFVVDKGEKDGVNINAAVLSGGTLIGCVSDVYENSAKVILITSKDSLVQAMLQDSRSKGILRGGISGLYLDDIMQDTDYRVGENIVTSGLGGKMKEGILIGKTGRVQSSTSGIFKTISVDPIVDLSKLELVFIEK